MHDCLLRKVTDLVFFESVPEEDLARKRLLQPQEGFHQSGLSRTVFTDDTEIIAFIDGEIQPFQNGAVFIAERQIFYFYH